MDGEAETDTVVIAGQPEVLSTQEMQVWMLGCKGVPCIYLFIYFYKNVAVGF